MPIVLSIPIEGGRPQLPALKGRAQDPHTLFFTPEALQQAAKGAGARILFQAAVGKPLIPRRKNPIYTPNPKDTFLNAAHGGLTIICTK